jgi:hypothetical protein
VIAAAKRSALLQLPLAYGLALNRVLRATTLFSGEPDLTEMLVRAGFLPAALDLDALWRDHPRLHALHAKIADMQKLRNALRNIAEIIRDARHRAAMQADRLAHEARAREIALDPPRFIPTSWSDPPWKAAPSSRQAGGAV